MYSKKKLANKTLINVSSSINFENKKLSTNKTIKKVEYERTKSFALPKKSPLKNKRPVSASHNFDRPISRANYGNYFKIIFSKFSYFYFLQNLRIDSLNSI